MALLSNIELILASKSPRRSQLLTLAGIPFTVRTRDIEESYPPHLSVDEVAAYLAQKKARATRDFLTTERQVLLTADSVVILDETIYGKPVDRADAQYILRQLSGRAHRVITGCCLLTLQEERVFQGVSTVHFKVLTDSEIDYYLDAYQPYDKAGAYAIQEWIGLCKIHLIEGTYANVMGLPVHLVYEELAALNESRA